MTNIQVTEDIIFDMGEGDKIVRIKIIDASKDVKPENFIPVKFQEASW